MWWQFASGANGVVIKVELVAGWNVGAWKTCGQDGGVRKENDNLTLPKQKCVNYSML